MRKILSPLSSLRCSFSNHRISMVSIRIFLTCFGSSSIKIFNKTLICDRKYSSFSLNFQCAYENKTLTQNSKGSHNLPRETLNSYSHIIVTLNVLRPCNFIPTDGTWFWLGGIRTELQKLGNTIHLDNREHYHTFPKTVVYTQPDQKIMRPTIAHINYQQVNN